MGINKWTPIILLSTLGTLMIGGATYAMFSASTAPIQQAFAAGTVKISEPFGFYWCGEKHFKNLEPGDNGFGNVILKNTGSLDEWVNLMSSLKGGQPDIFADFPYDAHPLRISYTIQLFDQYGLPIYQKYALGNYQTDNFPVKYFVDGCGCSSLTESTIPQSNIFFLPVSDSAFITFRWSFPLSAANDYQGASGTLNVVAQAIQASNNILFKSNIGIAPQVLPPMIS